MRSRTASALHRATLTATVSSVNATEPIGLFAHVQESPKALPESVTFRVLHSVRVWPQRPTTLRALWADMVMQSWD